MGRLRGALGSLGLLGLLGAMVKKEQDSSSPEAVWATPWVEALADFAMDLAARGDEGPDAVKHLRARARRRPKALRRAAAFVRFGGAIQEDRISHRANRLLL